MKENEVFEGIYKDCGSLEICNYKKTGCGSCFIKQTLIKAEEALEEVKQYRAIGTPAQIYEKIGGLDVELGKYHSIGTIEELQALKEEVELYRNLDKTNFSDGYNRGVDEFSEEMKWEYRESIGTSEREIHFALAVIDQVAERLKGGAEDGKCT